MTDVTELLTNGTFDSNRFALADSTGFLFWSGFDENPFWTGDELTFWGDVYEEMIYDATVIPDLTIVGEFFIAASEDMTIFAQNWNLQYKIDGTNIFWGSSDASLFWTDDTQAFWSGNDFFQVWPGQVGGLLRQRYLFRLTTESAKVQGRIEHFELRVETTL